MGRQATPEYNLATCSPKLAKEWHPTKNGELKPTDVTPNSGKRVWWLCSDCPYEWETSIYNRSAGKGCAACSGRVATPWSNLATEYPEVAKQWHPTKNGELKPTDVRPGSSKKVWWKCSDCPYEWESSVSNRSKGSGCGVCCKPARVAAPWRNLETERPELAKEWHPTKNGELKPTDVLPMSSKKVWWKCSDCPYEWESPIGDRSNGCGCGACCEPARVATPWRNLETERPELAKDWHPTKNGDLKPTDVLPMSGKRVWWLCSKCGHEMERAVSRKGCPACGFQCKSQTYANRKIATAEYNLAVCNPEVAKEWHQAKNGDLKPVDVLPVSSKKVWWKCSDCPYEWEASVSNRSKGNGCAACSGNVVAPWRNLATEYPEVAKEWHQAKNGDLKPTDVTPGSSKKVWWKCSECSHEWDSAIRSRSAGCGCPGCTGRVVTPSNNLVIMNPEVAKDWHPTKNGDLKPTDVIPGTEQKAWWLCSDCGHEWESRIVYKSRNNGCRRCKGKAATYWRNLETERPELAKDWHPTKNGDLKPIDVLPMSGKRVWWLCSNGHEWETTVSNRSMGRGCRACRYKIKDKVAQAAKVVIDIFSGKKKPPYNNVGKIQTCEMILEQTDRPGYRDRMCFGSMPGNGREAKQFLDNGVVFNYSECLGVERDSTQFKALRRLFAWLARSGKIPETIPMFHGDIDKLFLGELDYLLPLFNVVHLDYNGPLTGLHVLALEAALRNNPDAIVAITVSKIDRFGWRDINYKFGEFPFITLNPELLFYQPYQGIAGQWMETYCFRNKPGIFSMAAG